MMAVMSYFDYTAEFRKSLGIADNLVRIALGFEDVEDLVADPGSGAQNAFNGLPAVGSSRIAET